MTMNVSEFLQKLPAAVKHDEIDGLEGTAQLNISTPTYVVLKDGVCSVHEGVAEGADVTLTVSDENLIALLTGSLSGVMAFMTGKLKVDGDLMLAKTLPDLFDASKLS